MDCFKPHSHPTYSKVSLNNYTYLHLDGRNLISGWFERVWKLRDANPADCFEPFIFAWFPVNGWAACVTGKDVDRDYLKVLVEDEAISKQFKKLIGNPRTPFSIHAKDFAEYWPIFEVKDLRKKGILRAHEGERAEVVDNYFKGKKNSNLNVGESIQEWESKHL